MDMLKERCWEGKFKQQPSAISMRDGEAMFASQGHSWTWRLLSKEHYEPWLWDVIRIKSRFKTHGLEVRVRVVQIKQPEQNPVIAWLGFAGLMLEVSDPWSHLAGMEKPLFFPAWIPQASSMNRHPKGWPLTMICHQEDVTSFKAGRWHQQKKSCKTQQWAYES